MKITREEEEEEGVSVLFLFFPRKNVSTINRFSILLFSRVSK